MRVYKVVRESGDKLKSAVPRGSRIRGVAQLTYTIGEVTKPKFGKIFAFDNHADALAFSFRWRPDTSVYEATAPDAYSIGIIATDGQDNTLSVFKRFWAGGRTVGVRGIMDAPRGTVVCSELTLIRKMDGN